jgi:hypothetical protein
LDRPVQQASITGHGNIVIQAHGSGVNVEIRRGEPHLRLTLFEARTQLVSGDNHDAALLSAYRDDVVPLIGREAELADLQQWLDDEKRVSLRVMIGAGGRGKTRLALELARRAMAAGWLAGFVTQDELDRFRRDQNVSQWGWDSPTLIIVDYAAGRAEQLRDWMRELVDGSHGKRPPLRMLLVERQAQRAIGWLATMVGHGEDDASRAAISLLDPSEPVELAAIDDLAARHRIFATLLHRANDRLEAPALGVDPEFDRLLHDEKWAGDPLYLMMAGLVAGEHGVRGALSLTRTDLAENIAKREEPVAK